MITPGAYKLSCRNAECHSSFEWSLVLRPPALGRGKPPDTMIDLAPMKLALWRKRRLSARAFLHEYEDNLDIANVSPVANNADAEHHGRQAP